MGTKHYRRIEVGEYIIPDAVVSLIEDIQTLENILGLLEKIDGRNITVPITDYSKAKIEAQRMLRRVGFLLAGMHTIARENLRFEYMGGKRIKPREKRQTLAEVWQLLLDGSENKFERDPLPDGRTK